MHNPDTVPALNKSIDLSESSRSRARYMKVIFRLCIKIRREVVFANLHPEIDDAAQLGVAPGAFTDDEIHG